MAMQRWEYRVTEGETSEDSLNALGDEGWELVGVVAGLSGPRAYLKRPALPFKERVTLEQRAKYAHLGGYGFGDDEAVSEELP